MWPASRQIRLLLAVIPKSLPELLNDPDKEKAGRVMQAMLQMKKIDIEGLKKAYEQQ